ncbi:hypothetical protein ACH5RR_029312, partial [Cinchona calisaya]
SDGDSDHKSPTLAKSLTSAKFFDDLIPLSLALYSLYIWHFYLQNLQMAMNNDDENAMVISAATSVLAMGYVVLEFYNTHKVVPRAFHVNKDKARKDYMDSILYGALIV